MNRKLVSILIAAILLAFLSVEGFSAAIFSCKADQCVAKIEGGIVGDRVKIMDEKASVIAEGKIVKKNGAYAILKVGDSKKSIRKGYPVIVSMDSRSSNLQYGAAFSSKD